MVENPALQKAEMEWKTEKNIFSVSVANWPTGSELYIIIAPIASNVKVTITTVNMNEITLLILLLLIMSFRAIWFWMETDPVTIKLIRPAKVMMPRPPICISIRMITCPVVLNAVAVSTTISPVTHTALADVKNASTGWIGVVVALGSRSKNPPMTMRAAKLPTNRRAALTPRL